MTAVKQQHHVAAATASKPQQPQQRPDSLRRQPQGGCLPKPTRPPCASQVPQPGLPQQPSTEECYNIISDWAAHSAEQTVGIPPDQLHRQEKEYLQLVQNLQPSKEAEEEHSFWCE